MGDDPSSRGDDAGPMGDDVRPTAGEVEPGSGGTHGIMFKLDRFEPAGGDRIELSGRWFGVRGRRFIRPTLMLIGGGVRYRCLADLAGKPWAPTDGEPWQAAFPCDLEVLQALDEASFNVAPDITIALPPPGDAGGESSRREPAGERSWAGERMLRTSEETAVRRQLAIVTRTLEHERAETERLQRELEHSKAELANAASRLDQTVREVGAASADRDAARRARDAALREREAALKARDRAATELGEAIATRARATAERDAAIAERERTTATLGEERGARDRAIGEALGARDRARAERDALADAIRKLESDRAEAMSAHGAALVMRNSMRSGVAGREVPSRLWVPIAIVVVLAFLIALALHVL